MDSALDGLVFIRLHPFDHAADGLLDDEDIRLVEQRLMQHPSAGDVIARTNGVRKLRVAVKGRGKRGGARVLYLYVQVRARIFFLAVYDKASREDLTQKALAVLSKIATDLKRER